PSSFCFCLLLRPPTSTLFPYTTLFRSSVDQICLVCRDHLRTLCNLRIVVFKLGIDFIDVIDRIPSFASCGIHYMDHHLRPLDMRSEEHTSELQSRFDLVCRLLLEKKKY